MPVSEAPPVPPPAQPWLLPPSPPTRLNLPTLDSLPVHPPSDWLHALSAQQQQPSGLTPRFSPTFAQLQSPGVSADIAANLVDPNAPSQPLSDLFHCTEYPFSVAPQNTSVNPSRPPAPPKQNVISFQQAPPASTSAPAPASAPLSLPFPHPRNATLHQPAVSNPRTSFPQPDASTLPQRQPVNTNATAPVTPIAPASHPPDAVATVGSQRPVMGSALMSNAVHEAQIGARIKAESFARARKKDRAKRKSAVPKSGRRANQANTNLSPDELRKVRYRERLASNRESAAVSRVRKREYVKLLEEQLVNAEKERVRLANELMDMQKQQNKLKEHLTQLERAV